MSIVSPGNLKTLRQALGLTRGQAAASIDVTARTWRSYEASMIYKSHRTIPERSFLFFCEHHGVPFPTISNDGRVLGIGCKISSITAYKGRIGKSQITVDIAMELAHRDKRVAIITGDVVYRCSMDEKVRVQRRSEEEDDQVRY